MLICCDVNVLYTYLMHAYLLLGSQSARDAYYAQLPQDSVERLVLTPEKTTITIKQVQDLLTQLTIHAQLPRQIVIDPADTLSQPAANALLKTLEEPPALTTFYLGTAVEATILPTIRSRCTRLKLESSIPADAATYLPLVKQALSASPGDRLQLAATLPSDRTEAETVLYSLLKEIKSTLDSTSATPGLQLLAKIGTEVARAAGRLEANCSVSLTLQNLFLSLPRTK